MAYNYIPEKREISAFTIPEPGYIPYDESFKEKISDDERLSHREWYLCKHNILHFWYNWTWIVDKYAHRTLFQLNPIQVVYRNNESLNDIILKSRKVGISTYKILEALHARLFMPYSRGVLLCHQQDSTDDLYERWMMAYELLPWFLKPEAEKRTAKQIVFKYDPWGGDLNTSYRIATAGSVEIGRGWDLDDIHLSEFASYPQPRKIFSGILQAARVNARVSIESTAKGYNMFHTLWEQADEGTSKFKPHFFPWFDDPTCVEEPWPTMLGTMASADKKYFASLGIKEVNKIAFYLHKRDKEGLGREDTRQEYPSLASEAFVATSNSVFDIDLLNIVEKGIRTRMENEKDTYVDEVRDNGNVVIYKKPKDGWRYVMGVDTAAGKEGGDYSCAIILDNVTGEQVASLHGRWSVEVFAAKCDEYGRMYNNAVMCVERMVFGEATLERLRIIHRYPRLFYETRFDKSGGKSRELGFRPTMRNKPVLITNFQQMLRDDDIVLKDVNIIKECRHFVHLSEKRMGAETVVEGGEMKHDDRVIATALACWALLKYPWKPPKEVEEYTGTHRDWWFRTASKELNEARMREAEALRGNSNEDMEILTQIM